VFTLALLIAATVSGPPPATRTVSLPVGQARARFHFTAEVGAAFRDVRLVVPHGALVTVSAREADGQMAVGVSTSLRASPAARCIRRGRYDICDQQEEACPILNENWTVRVVKRTAAPARVRISFFFTRTG